MASPIIWTDVTNVASELTTAVGLQAVILAHVNGKGLDPAVFDGEDGTDTKLARSLLGAHMATMFAEQTEFGSTAGPISAETEGGISRQYAVLARAGVELDRTAYGRWLEVMIRVNACGAYVP